MSNAEKCCVCGNKFNGLFKADKPSDLAVQALKKLGHNVDDYCLQCYVKKRAEVENSIERNIEELKNKLQCITKEELNKIQVFTISPPNKWEFEIKGMVSGYSVIGTGLFTEIASSWTDFFGKESLAYNEKIRTGEMRAIDMAKMQVLKEGGNVLSGVKLSVTEATHGNGMLIISCVGTAIKRLDSIQEKFLFPQVAIELDELQKKLYDLKTSTSGQNS